jgi:hypothetical protein
LSSVQPSPLHKRTLLTVNRHAYDTTDPDVRSAGSVHGVRSSAANGLDLYDVAGEIRAPLIVP